ncbi:MAG: efflux RND transporter periplasmic adaptor subunit [Alphaproteobacteria bacterium]|nr:efflux RND transporter periplasmic adaptor subunit [Alphaproteobacteria bacterium]
MKKSHLMALLVTAILVLWMLPGVFRGPADTASPSEQDDPKNLMTVEIEEQDSKPVVSFIIAQGNVTPDREVTLRAETEGTVKEILIQEGQPVKEGDVILRLDMEDRQIRLERARARVAEMKRKYDAAKNLGEKGYAAQTRIDEALAQFKDAQAEEQQIMLEIGDTEIRAPFDGIIDKRVVEVGDFVSIKDEIVTVVDNNPLVIAVPIPQKEINDVSLGGTALIKIAGGKETGGAIRFIAPKADETTRTFRIEIEIQNPGGLSSGTSAEVYIPKKSIKAHAVSPGILTLDDKGRTGIKTVDENDIVHFYPIAIVSAETTSLFVSGLPDHARIIVNGQGYVREAEKVTAVLAKPDKPETAKNEEPPHERAD